MENVSILHSTEDHLRPDWRCAGPAHTLILISNPTLELLTSSWFETHSFEGQELAVSPFAWQSNKAILFYFTSHPQKSVQFSGIKYIYTVVQPSSLSISRTFWTFSSSQVETFYALRNNSPSLPLHPPGISFLLSVSMLPILDTSCKWNDTIFVLLCLTFFT